MFPVVSYIYTSGWVLYSTPGFFFHGCIYLLIPFAFSFAQLLMQVDCCCDPHLILKYPLLEFIPVDKDVDLWTLVVPTDKLYFCLFAVQFQVFLPVFFFCNNICKFSSFSANNSVSSAYVKLFTLYPLLLMV